MKKKNWKSNEDGKHFQIKDKPKMMSGSSENSVSSNHTQDANMHLVDPSQLPKGTKIYSDDARGESGISDLENEVNQHNRSVQGIQGQLDSAKHRGHHIDKSMAEADIQHHKNQIKFKEKLIADRKEKLTTKGSGGRSYEKSEFGFRKRTDSLIRLSLKRGAELGISPDKIVGTGGSNYNAPDIATPPDLEYTIYWTDDDPVKHREFLDWAKHRLDLKVKKSFGTGVVLEDIDVEPTNETFHKYGYDKIPWQDLTGRGIFDEHGRILGDNRFGRGNSVREYH